MHAHRYRSTKNKVEEAEKSSSSSKQKRITEAYQNVIKIKCSSEYSSDRNRNAILRIRSGTVVGWSNIQIIYIYTSKSVFMGCLLLPRESLHISQDQDQGEKCWAGVFLHRCREPADRVRSVSYRARPTDNALYAIQHRTAQQQASHSIPLNLIGSKKWYGNTQSNQRGRAQPVQLEWFQVCAYFIIELERIYVYKHISYIYINNLFN